MRHLSQNRQRGFTLVELMVVVTIVAILASIAIPSYREHMRRANRADAKTALLQDAQFLERNRTATNKYNKNAADGAALTKAHLPSQQSPSDGAARYTIDVDAEEATFTLTATPAPGGPMDGDKCGTLTLNEQGKKDVDHPAAGVTAADCWNK
jgi:type IV pilus assembly protein PilE